MVRFDFPAQKVLLQVAVAGGVAGQLGWAAVEDVAGRYLPAIGERGHGSVPTGGFGQRGYVPRQPRELLGSSREGRAHEGVKFARPHHSVAVGGQGQHFLEAGRTDDEPLPALRLHGRKRRVAGRPVAPGAVVGLGRVGLHHQHPLPGQARFLRNVVSQAQPRCPTAHNKIVCLNRGLVGFGGLVGFLGRYAHWQTKNKKPPLAEAAFFDIQLRVLKQRLTNNRNAGFELFSLAFRPRNPNNPTNPINPWF